MDCCSAMGGNGAAGAVGRWAAPAGRAGLFGDAAVRTGQRLGSPVGPVDCCSAMGGNGAAGAVGRWAASNQSMPRGCLHGRNRNRPEPTCFASVPPPSITSLPSKPNPLSRPSSVTNQCRAVVCTAGIETGPSLLASPLFHRHPSRRRKRESEQQQQDGRNRAVTMPPGAEPAATGRAPPVGARGRARRATRAETRVRTATAGRSQQGGDHAPRR